jgi:putative spermidine/putrescine transport system permease protein
VRAFSFVTLPQIAPSVIAACIIVFTYAFGAYEVPLLLGQSHPPALPVLAYRAYTDVDLAARPQAAAMAVVIAAISGLLVAAYLAARRWGGAR